MNLQNVARLLQDKKLTINEIILDKTQKEEGILYGARGFNMQVPKHLRKETSDYDVLVKKPKKVATEIANEFKRRIDDNVEVVKGNHRGTYRVRINNENVADFTQLKTRPSTKKVYGVKVRSLKSIKRNATRLLNNPKLSYRHKKDASTIESLKEIERIDSYFN